MKKLAFLLALLLVFSCTVQKRHYQKGYFVSWKKHSSLKERSKEKVAVTKTIERDLKETVTVPPAEAKPMLVADVSKTMLLAPVKKRSVFSSGEDSCDVLIYKDGSEAKIKILEITSTTVKYKKCSMPDGPIYITEKSKLFMVKYTNGTNEVFKTQEPSPTYQSQPQRGADNGRRYVKKKTSLATTGLVFAILGFYPAIFIGGLVAIITSLIQLNLIHSDPETYGGEKKAKVAFIMGVCSVVMWVAIIGLIILVW